MNAEQNAENAKRLLRHYLSMAVEAKGYRFDGDSKAEIDDIVDYIIAAAKPAPVAQAASNGASMPPMADLMEVMRDVATQPSASSDTPLNQALASLEAYERAHAAAEDHHRNERVYQRSVAQEEAIYYAHQTQMRTAIASAAALDRIAWALQSIASVGVVCIPVEATL